MHNIQIYLVSPCFLHATHTLFTLLALPTNRNFVQFLFAEIPWNSACRVLFRLLWCWLLPWPLQLIRTGLIWILDFWYPVPCQLMQELLVLVLFF